MAAAIPFVTIEQAISSLAKVDVLHELMDAMGWPGEKKEFFLVPSAIHAVSEGDHELWEGAVTCINSELLRFAVGDRVLVLDSEEWIAGIIIRQPANDGLREAYDVKLSDGRRVLIDDDDDDFIRAGDPRRVHHFEVVFAAFKVRTAHDDAIRLMGQFGQDVQLASTIGPPEIMGRCVRQLSESVFDDASDALYEATVDACAELLGVTVPPDWRDLRERVAQQQSVEARTALQMHVLSSGDAAGTDAIGFEDEAEDSAPVYQPPENQRPEDQQAEDTAQSSSNCSSSSSSSSSGAGNNASTAPPAGINGAVSSAGNGSRSSVTKKRQRSSDPADLPYLCPAVGCSKCYANPASLYQHKRTHHPELMPPPVPVPAGKRPRGRPPTGSRDEDDLRFSCQAPGCGKSFASSAGLYQHKRAHHPQMINRRTACQPTE